MAAIQAMTLATCALVAWMSSNRLRLNPSKTQYIWLGTRQQLAKLDIAAMAVSFPHTAFLLTVRDLGLTLDKQLPLLLILTAYAANSTTSCVSYVSSLSHLHCYCCCSLLVLKLWSWNETACLALLLWA